MSMGISLFKISQLHERKKNIYDILATEYLQSFPKEKENVNVSAPELKILFPFALLKHEQETSLNSSKDHYNDVIMGAIASKITRLTIVYSTVYSDVDQRKHQSSASLAFVHRWIPRTNG